MAHYAHYVRRELVEPDYKNSQDPWFAENQPEDAGLDRPEYHITRSMRGPAARVAAGDTLWLFSSLSTPWGNFPPALDARISVSTVGSRPAEGNKPQPGFRYAAGGDSRWFPLCDATPCIQGLRTKSAAGGVGPLLATPRQPIGQALQSLRELEDASPLAEWALKLEATPPDFVSYRLRDGTRAAFTKAIALVGEGRAVFWDRWSLPRRLAERRELLDDPKLDSHIGAQIARSRIVWGISTPLYGEAGTYSAREKREAERLGKLRECP